MSLRKFVGMGVDHKTNVSDYLEEQLKLIKPQIITIEDSLNRVGFASFPYEKNYDPVGEFDVAAKVAIDLGIPYYLVDGNHDISKFPYFSDVEVAATVQPYRDKGERKPPFIKFKKKKYFEIFIFKNSNGKYDLDLSKVSQKEINNSISRRNKFSSDVINEIVDLEGDIDTLVHVGGLSHFDKRIYERSLSPSKKTLKEYVPLQDLINANEKIVIDAVRRKIIYTNKL